MASLLQRLLRRQSPTKFTYFISRNSGYRTLAPALLTHRSQSIDSRLSSLLPPQPQKDGESAKTEVKYDYVYPSFSYGLVVNPVFQKVVTEDDEVVDDHDSGKMWADSTKKKRKKKMNKHKYKKLRKSMRNK